MRLRLGFLRIHQIEGGYYVKAGISTKAGTLGLRRSVLSENANWSGYSGGYSWACVVVHLRYAGASVRRGFSWLT